MHAIGRAGHRNIRPMVHQHAWTHRQPRQRCNYSRGEPLQFRDEEIALTNLQEINRGSNLNDAVQQRIQASAKQ